MGAAKGNQWWKLRAKHGRDAIFTDPNTLLEACEEYFIETDKRKWLKKEAIKSGSECGKTVDVPTETPYSLTGLCIFLDVNTQYFDDFKKSETYKNNKDFSLVITRVEEIIDTHQFEGAVVGAFNANIIARKLGLTDKSEIDHSNKDGTMQQKTIIVTNEESKKIIEKFDAAD